MARAYGANAQLLGHFETTYGTPPSGNYIKFPFVSSALGSEQGLIASDLLGTGRDPRLKVSEWADANRFLSQTASGEPGPWRTERTPYAFAVKPLDDFGKVGKGSSNIA